MLPSIDSMEAFIFILVFLNFLVSLVVLLFVMRLTYFAVKAYEVFQKEKQKKPEAPRQNSGLIDP